MQHPRLGDLGRSHRQKADHSGHLGIGWVTTLWPDETSFEPRQCNDKNTNIHTRKVAPLTISEQNIQVLVKQCFENQCIFHPSK